MLLRDLLGDGPRVDITSLAYDNRAVAPGTLFFCVPGFTRDGHDFAPDASSAARRRSWWAGNSASACPRSGSTDVRAAMAPTAARFYGDPTRVPAGRGHHRHQRQDARPASSARSSRPPGSRAGCWGRSSRWSAARSARSSAPRPRRSTSSGPSARCWTPATSRARWRSPPTRSSCAAPTGSTASRGLHQPHAGPPGLPSRHGGLLPGQAAAVRGRPGRADRQRRRPLRAAAGRRSSATR